MSIETGSAADPADIEKNIINSLEQAYQITFLSKDASVADKTYAYVESDITSDSNGFNNHIDTGNTTARFLGDRYVLGPGTIYDNFNDNSLDLAKWTKTETPATGTATVNEQNQRIEIDCAINGLVVEAVAFLESDTNYTDFLRWDAVTVDPGATNENSHVYVSIGGTIIVDKDDGATVATYDDYATGTWEIFKVSTSVHRLYKDNVFVREIASALSGAVRFYCKSKDDNSNGSVANHDFDNVYLTFASSSYVQTNSKTFPANAQEILVDVNNDVSLSGTSMDFDASTDGGSAFEKTDQAFDTVISGLDNDNTGMVIRINLKASGTGTPWLLSYAYQGWTA